MERQPERHIGDGSTSRDAGRPADRVGSASSVPQPAQGEPGDTAPARRAGGMRAVRRATLTAVGLAVLLYLAVWILLFAVLTLGPFGPVTYAALLGAVAAIAGPWLLVHRGAAVRRSCAAVGSWLARRMGATLAPTEERGVIRGGLLQQILHRLGLVAVWNRTARLWVLLGLGVALALIWSFVVLLVQVVSGGTVSGGALAGTDLRVLNLVALLRMPSLDQAMYTLTYLGDITTVVVVTAAGVGIALLARRYADALVILVAPISGGLFVEIVKLLVARPRPPLADARIVADGFSFPSGHATVSTMLYGTLAYLLLRRNPALPGVVRSLIASGTALLIFAIGLSRIYLGVHYPSDVLAGWTAGTLWLVALEVLGHVWQPVPVSLLPPQRQTLAPVGSALLIVGAIAALVALYPTLPPPPAVPTPTPVVLADDAVQTLVITQLPHVTETLFGAPQEPVSLALVGTRDQVLSAFAAAGWTEAERPEPGNLASALWAGISGKNDPAGPVAPSFLADEPNVLAFSQEAGESFDQRHHVRLWSTLDVTASGQNVWLGTASFDSGFGLARGTLLPTHHIAPNIDGERAYLTSSLAATREVASTQTFQLVPPTSGTNFVGDPFFTDGRAVLLVLL